MQIPDLSSVVLLLQQKGIKNSLHDLLRVDEERAICKSVERSGIQDPALVRYRSRAHLMALALIDERGHFDLQNLEALFLAWEKGGRFFYEDPASDTAAYELVLKRLQWLLNDETARKEFLKFSMPLASSYLEGLVKAALFLPANHVLETVDVRRAVLSSLFCFLRQSVGSCFATAPAILIHNERPELFLQDMEEILFTSRMKRVIEGVEYAVPCSPSWGIGDLKKDLSALPKFLELHRSVGLLQALAAAGIPMDKIAQIPQNKKPLFVDEFLENLILQEFGIERSSWEHFQKRRRLFPRQLLIQREGANEAPLEKLDAAIKAAKDAFRAVADHPLLKTWEYTLASFSEVKMEFSGWNLYSSLGMDPKEPLGIGSILGEDIDLEIEEANKKIETLQGDYAIAFDQVRATEALFRNVSSENEARRLSAEHQSRVYHMQTLLEMREQEHRKGTKFVSLLSFLLNQYSEKFPEYFQEIYDAELFDPNTSIYQDSAAGFRLVYKHGRRDPSQWTTIKDKDEYIEALVDFFKMSEPQIIDACKEETIAKEIPRLTDKVIHHLHTKEFLDSAILRMKKAHTSMTLPGLAKEMLAGEKTPWAYISGGTMEVLLKTYFRCPSKIFQEGRWVESASDLFILLLETLKGISLHASEALRKDPERRLLMHSPTHAFSLQPGSSKFCEGWIHDSFSYTWVRDQLLEPSKKFYEGVELEADEAGALYEALQIPAARVSSKLHLSKFIASVHPKLADELDALLFLHLPFLPQEQWKPYVSKLISVSLADYPNRFPYLLSSQALRNTAMAIYLLSHGSLQTEIDLHGMVLQNAVQSGLAAPRIIFADTNWPHFHFAFAYGAASARLRLFRIDPAAQTAAIMNSWEHYLNGTDRLPWVVYSKLEQYS